MNALISEEYHSAFGILSSLIKLEELKMLESFDGWEAEENGKEMRNASLTELECLPNLTCLEIQISDSNLAAREMRLSPKLVKYRLYIAAQWWYEGKDDEKVMKLKLPSGIGAVGKWIQILVKETEWLCLEGDDSNNINLEECQVLRNLQFRECSRVKKLVKTKYCKSGIVFPLLETLNLLLLGNLEEICDGTIILNQNVSLFCNLKSIEIRFCSNLRYLFTVSVAIEQVFRNEIRDDTDGCIEFPKLKTLTLRDLPNLTAFCQGVQNIKFPNLTELEIGALPKLNSLCPLDSETPHDDTTPFHFFCNPKVEMSDLKGLTLIDWGDNIRNIWCGQIPMNFFNNIQKLTISNGLRSSMPYSIAKNLVSLQNLYIYFCLEIVEVIEGNDDDKEVVDIKCLFPALKTLSISSLHKLRRFWQCNHALELPLLEQVHIINCHVMEAFTTGFLNTPNLKSLTIDHKAIDHKKDLNDAIHHHFRTESKKHP